MSQTSSATKDCPQCRALLAADAASCTCGHHFKATVSSGRPAGSLLAQAEELYETHLRARMQRAMRVVKLAKVDLLRDPGNPTMKIQLRDAEKEVKLLEAQLMVQIARVADAHAAERGYDEPASAAADTQAPETFRATQAVKAEQSFELINLELAAERLRANQSTGVFKAIQAEKARAAERHATQNCPGCGLPVAIGVARCDCGYRLHNAESVGDFLSADELAALRGSS